MNLAQRKKLVTSFCIFLMKLKQHNDGTLPGVFAPVLTHWSWSSNWDKWTLPSENGALTEWLKPSRTAQRDNFERVCSQIQTKLLFFFFTFNRCWIMLLNQQLTKYVSVYVRSLRDGWEMKTKRKLTILPRLNSLNHEPGTSLGHEDILTFGK